MSDFQVAALDNFTTAAGRLHELAEHCRKTLRKIENPFGWQPIATAPVCTTIILWLEVDQKG